MSSPLILHLPKQVPWPSPTPYDLEAFSAHSGGIAQLCSKGYADTILCKNEYFGITIQSTRVNDTITRNSEQGINAEVNGHRYRSA